MTTSDVYGAKAVFPTLRYKDAHAAIAWIENVLGFERRMAVPGEGGSVVHAELSLGPVFVMLSSVRTEGIFASAPTTEGPYIAVDKIDELYEHVKSSGGDIAMEIADQDYGSRDFSVRDPEGRIWSFGTYVPSREGAAS